MTPRIDMTTRRPAWTHRGRQSRQARGYGSSWDRLRLVILKRDNWLCWCDQCLGGELRVRSANEVDHIKPRAQGGTDDPSNLRAINSECHRRISLEQQGKQPRPRHRYDAKGYRIE